MPLKRPLSVDKVMPSNDNHEAHDYAERIRERLPRRSQELRERCGLSKYGLTLESGLSGEYIGKLGLGAANPTLPVTAQVSHGMGMTLTQFTVHLETAEAGMGDGESGGISRSTRNVTVL